MYPVKVLLVQLASNGDCLLVTPIAKQIKEIDYPGCHLTWLIGSKFSAVLINNPYIDEIMEIPINTTNDTIRERNLISERIETGIGYLGYNKVIITDYTRINYKNWFGTTRSSLFRSYPHLLKVNPQPLIYLSDQEKEGVYKFSVKNKLTEGTFNILFECVPHSGQSSMTLLRAKEIAERLISYSNRIKVILSSNQTFDSDLSNLIDGSEISWRENAELANYCQLLVGCSSGISWLCTSNWTKPLPFIQVINPAYRHGRISASMKADFRYFGMNTANLIELNNPTNVILEECILATFDNKFTVVKAKHDASTNYVFSNYQFLKQARIQNALKLWIFIRYCIAEHIYQLYLKVKPDRFRPPEWLRNIKSRLKSISV